MRRNSFLAVIAAAVVIGSYGAWVLTLGVEGRAWQSVLFGGVALISAAAMLARKAWSRFLVYALVAHFCVTWVAVEVDAVNSGAWEKYDLLRIFLSLLPGLGMVAVAFACAYVAKRFLRPASLQA
jgi:hypothetical protein